MRGGLTIAALIGFTAVILYAVHTSLKALDKPFDDEPDWDASFKPDIPGNLRWRTEAATRMPILRESVNGVPGAARAVHTAPKDGNALIESDGFVTVHPTPWVSAANADEARFCRVVARLEAAGTSDNPRSHDATDTTGRQRNHG